ncbi:MAG: carboxymuconolactone decarboxylase family protein [Candidatus Aquilonibacter sp.]
MKMTDETGPWDAAAFDQLERWTPAMSTALEKVTNDPWTGALDPKTVELVCVAFNASCTNLNADGTRLHIRNALAAGATRDELLTVLMMASLLSIHTCSLGAPILIEEAKNAGVTATAKQVSTPNCDRMHAAGEWNAAWDPFYALDPAWTDAVMACGVTVFAGGVFGPKVAEFLSIALDASITHMYAPGTRRHIKAALAHGATVDEIMDVLKLCVAQGVQALNMGVPILDEELSRTGG